MARAMGCSAADLLSEEVERGDKNEANKTEESSPDVSELAETDGVAVNAAVGDAEISPASDNKDPVSSELKTGESPASDLHSSEVAAAHEKFYEDIINLYKNEMKKKDVWISRLFWCLTGIVAFILFVLVFDILHPTFGFVKY